MSVTTQVIPLEELRDRIADVIEQRFGTSRDALLSDTSFIELDFDSLILVEMQLLLEEQFGVHFEDEGELPKNMSELADLVRRAVERKKH